MNQFRTSLLSKQYSDMKVLLVCLMVVSVAWTRSSSRSSLSCDCGWRNAGRIVGGKEAQKNEYPWMVYLSIGDRICGGSIITPWHILTAAHCTDGKSASDFIVYVGMHYIWNKNPLMKEHRVARIFEHESYDENDSFKYDIAILVLKTPISFNKFVGPVCMPKSKTNLLGKFIKVIGWGLTQDTGDQNALREVDVEVISNSVCKRSWNITSIPTQICTYTANKDSCRGDSGGPLVYLDPDTNRFTQVALVSYGPIECGTDPRPSVNMDVFALNSWIQKAIASSQTGAQVCTKV